jgi:hypothetical protein
VPPEKLGQGHQAILAEILGRLPFTASPTISAALTDATSDRLVPHKGNEEKRPPVLGQPPTSCPILSITSPKSVAVIVIALSVPAPDIEDALDYLRELARMCGE